jgi:predicted lipid-binding transport protein (Tim44 family)
MPEWVKWFFDGLGTAIISLLVGALAGGLVGFRIGKRKNKFIQSQEAGSGAEQYQKGSDTAKMNITNLSDSKSIFCQSQKAGDNSKQTQIGGQGDV